MGASDAGDQRYLRSTGFGSISTLVRVRVGVRVGVRVRVTV